MQIELSKIKSSPQAIRTTWSEEKMEELAQSIKQHGLLQAIKVRPVGEEYEVVYGHRRAEASRRAELTHIEAVVHGMDDLTALVQALIENVVREDLGAMDKARGLKALKDVTDWSNKEVERQGIMPASSAGRLLALLKEPEEIQNLISEQSNNGVTDGNPHEKLLTEFHVRSARESGLSKSDRVTVLNKAAREGLTAAQTREVADAFKRVENDYQAKKDLTELPLVRSRETMEVLVGHRTEQHEKKEAKVYGHLDDLNVKAFAEAISAATTTIRAQWQLVDKNLIGAEHMPYLAERLRRLAEELNSKAGKLEKMRKEEVDA